MRENDACQGLYDPRYERDACGVGFVADVKGRESHLLVESALGVLQRLAHRGATGVDPETGDGAGILLNVPDGLFRPELAEMGVELPQQGRYGVAMCFVPRDPESSARFEHVVSEAAMERGHELLAWRDVPVDDAWCGPSAREHRPLIRQAFIARRGIDPTEESFERALYVLRRRIEHELHTRKVPGYLCSLSSRTIVYKGLLLPDRLPRFYVDLADPRTESALAVVHQRFSTNTFPSWERAHPYRLIAHNGEINALRGNVNAMRAREATLAGEFAGLGPVIDADGSDSAMFDNVLELLVRGGRSIPHAAAMMLPEAWEMNTEISTARRGFFAYHASVMEPWDGPAAIVFTDGRIIGASLDRNGLRPLRIMQTDDGWLVVASEAGTLDVPPEKVVRVERLGPGRMLVVDTGSGEVLDDDAVKERLAAEHPYARWIAELLPVEHVEATRQAPPETLALRTRQHLHGYTDEDLRRIVTPMAESGEEPVGSMGNDTPIALLSRKPQSVFDHFKQLFAQVTNPPIDPLREADLMSIRTTLGIEPNLLIDGPQHCRRLLLDHPIISDDEYARVTSLDRMHLRAGVLSTLLPGPVTGAALAGAVEALCTRAADLVRDGITVLVLSDAGTGEGQAAVPALLAVSAVHHHLIQSGLRTRCSLVTNTSEAREVMHFCLLLGFGASLVHPSLALESVRALCARGAVKGQDAAAAQERYLKAANKGILKVMSKMGISALQSYRGAQIFEALGLKSSLVDRYFPGTATRLEGADLDAVAASYETRRTEAFAAGPETAPLESGGRYQWRRDGEDHLYDAETIGLMQHAVRSGSFEAFQRFSARVNRGAHGPRTLRELLVFRAREPVPIDEVEPAAEIVKRFRTGAMSFGSISREAHETLAVAMNRLGGRSNSGEGGEDAARFVPDADGAWRRSAIKQVASARFGVTSHYLVNADELQIKMAQGAKPGEGGQLPGHKVDAVIARLRHSTPGVPLISPPPHHDIYSIEDLAQLIFDLRNANDRADISVKLVSEAGVGTVAAGVAKAGADRILISGDAGGTGAAPLGSIRHAGIPWEIGLSESQQVLVRNGLRSRVRIETDGQLKTGRDVAIAALLGADDFGFATAALVASGCLLMRVCHMNTCPVGIATQDPVLRARFPGAPDHVINFMVFVAEELRAIMASLGFRTVAEMIGRVDCLEVDRARLEGAARDIDLDRLLHRETPLRSLPASDEVRTQRIRELAATLDARLLPELADALQRRERTTLAAIVQNVDRTVGTRISAEISRRHGAEGLAEDTIVLELRGTAGQSFGAFGARGLTLRLEGAANDHVGKGLSGGRIVIVPPRASRMQSADNVIVGNVALYGATGGELFARGKAGERFAVRNSGATAVVEGVGDHGCEYMTGGTVVVLGGVGRNFAAGMSGGIAYVLDDDGTFGRRVNRAMVSLDALEPEDVRVLRELVGRHREYTGSTIAWELLARWRASLPRFVRVMPHEYRRVLEARARASAAE